ncbi:MAG: hypothetical protein ABH840_04265 [Nanoarchaeota archaeon]
MILSDIAEYLNWSASLRAGKVDRIIGGLEKSAAVVVRGLADISEIVHEVYGLYKLKAL